MDDLWEYQAQGMPQGPVAMARLAELAQVREIGPDTPVRRPGEQVWSSLYERLPEIGAAPPPPPPDYGSARPKGAWSDTKPHPWRRYFARFLDNIIIGTLTWTVVAAVFFAIDPVAATGAFAVFEQPLGGLFETFLTLVFAIPGIALMIGLTGLSIGKFVFGVRVLRPDGRPIGMQAAFVRELKVWVYGLGLGLPIVSLVTLIMSIRDLGAHRSARWDREMGFVVVHRREGPLQTALFVAGVIAIVGVVGAIRLAASA